ncbi:ABC transporter permease [Streptomyces sp. NPDC057027]|uniref:ABC transporter permease n=1 Tax=Streptomyces sp. NPDC057027 TaxID=3346004 RepID=UPI00362BAB34
MSTLALKGPYWVTLRQYRRTLWLAVAGVLASLAVIGGLRIWDAQTPDTRTVDGTWIPANDTGHAMLRWAMEYANGGLVLLPLLIAAFVAGPLVAREYESGTYRLSLTQSQSPAAWLRTKLLTTGAVALATTLALIGVYRIGWDRVAHAWNLQWGDRGPYEGTGVVLPAYVLAALAVGALLGLLIRRTLIAMATAGLVMGAVTLTLGALRWSFLPVKALTYTGPLARLPEDGLLMGTGLVTSGGARFEQSTCWEAAATGSDVSQAPDAWNTAYQACLTQHHVTGQYVDYHPASHFWPTQLIETGILLALATLAALAAFRVLRSRHP